MNHRHRKVLHALFAHPVSTNIHFKDVMHVFEELGAEVDNKSGNRVGVKLNGHAAAFSHAQHSLTKGRGGARSENSSRSVELTLHSSPSSRGGSAIVCVAYRASLSLAARSRRCSRVYSSNSETPNSSSITPQITSIDASRRARLVAGTMSP